MASKAERQIAATEAGRARRVAAAEARQVRWESKVKPFLDTVRMTMQQRVKIATEHLKTRVMLNISRPVTKVVSKITGRIVVKDRSKAGEYPKADTTLMLKSVISDTWEGYPGVYEGGVGTPLGYGAILETSKRLDRRWLSKTLDEERGMILSILGGPLK